VGLHVLRWETSALSSKLRSSSMLLQVPHAQFAD
jgi:hypothetical protein